MKRQSSREMLVHPSSFWKKRFITTKGTVNPKTIIGKPIDRWKRHTNRREDKEVNIFGSIFQIILLNSFS